MKKLLKLVLLITLASCSGGGSGDGNVSAPTTNSVRDVETASFGSYNLILDNEEYGYQSFDITEIDFAGDTLSVVYGIYTNPSKNQDGTDRQGDFAAPLFKIYEVFFDVLSYENGEAMIKFSSSSCEDSSFNPLKQIIQEGKVKVKEIYNELNKKNLEMNLAGTEILLEKPENTNYREFARYAVCQSN